MEIKALLHRLTMIQRYSVYRVDYAFPYVYERGCEDAPRLKRLKRSRQGLLDPWEVERERKIINRFNNILFIQIWFHRN